MLTRIEPASLLLDQLVERFRSEYPYTGRDVAAVNLREAFDDHARAMKIVQHQHQELLADRARIEMLQEVLRPQSLVAHGVGVAKAGGVQLPVIDRGVLVTTDRVTASNTWQWGATFAIQHLADGNPEEIVVAPRGIVPIVIHDQCGHSAIGVYPEPDTSLLRPGLFRGIRTAVFAPGLDRERLVTLATAACLTGVEVRLISVDESDNIPPWGDEDALRAAITGSVDLVLHLVDTLPEVGHYEHEQARKHVEELIAALPNSASARRDHYTTRLAKVTKRSKRDVARDLREVKEAQATGRSHHVAMDLPDLVVWPTRETRPLRAGQDAVGATLLYTVEVEAPPGNKQPMLVTSERKLVPLTPDALEELGLEMPDDPVDVMASRWSRQVSVANSLPQFLRGDSETGMDALLDDLEAVLRKHLWFKNERVYLVLATMIVASYYCALANTVAYIFLYGLRETGKTLLLEILDRLCFNAFTGLPSRASIYRLTHKYAATLLVDEVKKRVNPDVLAVLKTGYRRGGRAILVVKGRPLAFDSYGFKVLAGTRGYDDELLDRGILLVTERRRDGKSNFDAATFEEQEARQLRNRLYCITLANADRIYKLLADPDTSGPLTGRERELFILPSAIARLADEEEPQGRWERLMEFAASNKSTKEAVVSAGALDAQALIEAVAAYCHRTEAALKAPHTHIAADLARYVAAAMNRKATTKQIGAELVQVGILGTAPADRPKLWVAAEERTKQCWRIDPERLAEVAGRLGVDITRHDNDVGE